MRDHAAKGVDAIKLFTGSAQAQGKVAVLPPAVARAAVEEAHRHRLPVFAHPQNVAGLNVALASGVDVLAHTVSRSPPWITDLVLQLKTANMALILTLTLVDSELRKANVSDRERDDFVSKMVAQLRAFSQAGGDVLFGTDIPICPLKHQPASLTVLIDPTSPKSGKSESQLSEIRRLTAVSRTYDSLAKRPNRPDRKIGVILYAFRKANRPLSRHRPNPALPVSSSSAKNGFLPNEPNLPLSPNSPTHSCKL